MPLTYDDAKRKLLASPRTWLVTGAGGFIGSHLLEELLRLGQSVVGLDNFSTGSRRNLQEVEVALDQAAWQRFRLVEGDIREAATCRAALVGVQHILHQAGLGSVSRSFADPVTTNDVNVSGFLTILAAARDAGIASFVYASSSAVYGDSPDLPKVEPQIGNPLSPYAVSKRASERYAEVFGRTLGLKATGLRYFNVFGPRQNADGPYAAVIPKWTASMMAGQDVAINGNGETSRDFCYVRHAVQGTLLAALADAAAVGNVYNIAGGQRTSLNALFELLRAALAENGISYEKQPVYRGFRPGDVLHSEADIDKAARLLGYRPTHSFAEGLRETVCWYLASRRDR